MSVTPTRRPPAEDADARQFVRKEPARSPAAGGGGAGSDTTAIHDNVAAEISAITEKVTPVSADLIIIEDSAAANAKKRVQIGNLGAVVATDDVSSPPTDAELDAAFGDPATLGAGFTGLLDDNDAGTAVWLCYVVAGAWWYEALTKAV